MVAFGEAEDGGGLPDVRPLEEITQTEQIPAPASPSRPANNDLLVQEDEESLVLAKQTEDEAKRRAEEEELIRKRKEDEARAEAMGNEMSLYHIIKPEINFEPGTDEHDPKVYDSAVENFNAFQQNGWLIQDENEHYYIDMDCGGIIFDDEMNELLEILKQKKDF